MAYISKTLLICAALSVAACSNASRFGNSDGVGSSGLDGSAAYFQQAVGDRVLFEVDQANLTPDSMLILDAQARWLATNSDYSALIEGHTDEQGTREYNLGLGARRANAVQEYLVSQGVAATRLRTVSYGKERPLELCSAERCYSKNRRAVTVISAEPAS